MLSAVRSSILIVLFLALCQARVVYEIEGEVFDPTQVTSALQPLIDNIRQAKQFQQTATITVIKTTAISSATTTVITTKKTCAVLASVVAGTVGGITTFTTAPAATCRRKRQFWDQNVFIALKDEHDSNAALQYFRLSPSQVLSFEPTLLPQFRNTPYNKGIELMKPSPLSIEPSFEKSPANVRVASPVFGGALNSIISSIVSSLLTSFTTTTSFVSSFTSTVTSTSFTATTSYYVVGNCYPAGVTTC